MSTCDPARQADFADLLPRPDGKALDVMLSVLAPEEYGGRFCM